MLHVLVYYLSFWILLNLDFSAADMIVYDGAGINTRLTVQWNCDHVIALILTVGGQISFFCIRAQVMVRGKGGESKEGNRE